MHQGAKIYVKVVNSRTFQFPLLGFLLCIPSGARVRATGLIGLSIPFIGIFALHQRKPARGSPLERTLSIPFIGIFALHHQSRMVENLRGLKAPFNSLYWDFCFASCSLRLWGELSWLTFNSLYWDFCFASDVRNFIQAHLDLSFQFPLLGFLLCIMGVAL